MISLIVAMDKNRVIGHNNQLPWHLPNDLKFFKKITLNKKILMGRKTFLSIGRPLPKRHNIVLTRQPDFYASGIEIQHNLQNSLDKNEEIIIIGGQEIFEQTIIYAKRLYITLIDAEVIGDSYFPEYKNNFKIIQQENHQSDDKHKYNYSFLILDRI